MSKKITVHFTKKELMDVFESLETMKSMIGAMDQEFNRECKEGNDSFHRALKRSGYQVAKRNYNNSNFKP